MEGLRKSFLEERGDMPTAPWCSREQEGLAVRLLQRTASQAEGRRGDRQSRHASPEEVAKAGRCQTTGGRSSGFALWGQAATEGFASRERHSPVFILKLHPGAMWGRNSKGSRAVA